MAMKKILAGLFFCALTTFCLGIKPAFTENSKVIVAVRSKELKPYNDALSGFTVELGKSGYKVSFSYNLEDHKGKEAQLAAEIKNLKPDLISTIGTEATLFAKDNLKVFPVLFFMVVNPVESGIIQSAVEPGDKMTGVSLDIPPELQFQKLKEILPKLSRVGLIYNSKEDEWLKKVESTAKKLDLVIVAKPINSAADVPHALDELMGSADCLWAQVDPLIYNAQSSQYILLTLLRNKMPFMAFSSQYVKAGALLTLECDYGDIGRQAAQMAIRMLADKGGGPIPLVLPEKTNLVINQKIAQLIGIDIPHKISEEAKEVY